MTIAPAVGGGALLGLAGAGLLLAERRGGAGRGGPARAGRRGRAAPTLRLRPLQRRLRERRERARLRLELAGGGKTTSRLRRDRVVCALTLPAIPLLPLAAVEGHAPSLWLAAPLAAFGLAVPDLSLRRALARRRAQVLLDLPEALAVLSLALAAGRSLHQALALAARESGGPLGADLTAALSLARREPELDERRALVALARRSGEPSFVRFAELLAAKESPYLDFLRTQAAQARAEQNRALERAADRAYLAMHAPLAPLLATLVLLVAYGFLHLLDQSI